jgi:hypothetical protein
MSIARHIPVKNCRPRYSVTGIWCVADASISGNSPEMLGSVSRLRLEYFTGPTGATCGVMFEEIPRAALEGEDRRAAIA